MTDEKKISELSEPWESIEPSAAAVGRYYGELGELMQQLGFMLTWREKAPLYVYKMEIRWPRSHSGDLLCILKAVSSKGPVIAFHSDRTLTAVLVSLSGRLRSGKLSWRLDEYPPDNYAEYVASIERGDRQYIAK